MLRKEQNDLLTQTGPGTPMGRLFRFYWTPVLLASELPENDCPPVRVAIQSRALSVELSAGSFFKTWHPHWRVRRAITMLEHLSVRSSLAVLAAPSWLYSLA